MGQPTGRTLLSGHVGVKASAEKGRSAAAAAGGEVAAQVLLDDLFPADRVVVEDAAVATDIERKCGSALGEQDRGLANGVRVTEFVEDVG